MAGWSSCLQLHFLHSLLASCKSMRYTRTIMHYYLSTRRTQILHKARKAGTAGSCHTFLNEAHQTQPLPLSSVARATAVTSRDLKIRNENMAESLAVAGADSSSASSSPELRSESRGSSVSAELREEYEDILKYAVVAPKLLGESSTCPPTIQSQPPAPTSTERRCE